MTEYQSQELENHLQTIDENGPAPETEPERQYYFIKKTRAIISALSQQLGRPLFYVSATFGCQMNARDSEKLAGILTAVGFTRTESEEADFVIYNTCTVRDNADQHVYGRLGRVSHYKKANPQMKIALCGCMMQEKSAVEKVKKSYPFVDLMFGTHNLFRFPEYLFRLYDTGKKVTEIWNAEGGIVEELPIDREFPFKSGVNIMFGCNNFCSYCIVPYVRGRERSRKPQEILREIERLAADGVSEVMLLGQNVNSYGKNLEEPVSFAQLLEAVCQIDGIRRVRFMSSHPKDLSEELIQTMKRNPKVARHLHLAMQSGSTQILQRMNRRYTKEQFVALAQHIREEIPDMAITTDIIVGFPGETPADVDETIDVIRKVRFDNAFTFIYSMRSGTPAAQMEQVPEQEKHEQFDRVLAEVQKCAREQAARWTGEVMEGLVESVNEHDPSYVTARLSNNMLVHIKGDASMIGQYHQIHLDECKGFYYFGTIEPCTP
ncbi:MAG: tRNA (N6-isopentenyl adenosine(37)-C2)-methylthiotransferase MiaB, partial [Eubacteriales bacterium]|nr:tRNA (N6-isopentenyl adenosine(37)-C2)-methylthiotransferase MiaB [Eubacteriales bacterium]